MLRFWLVLLCLCSSLACATPQDEDLAYSLGAKLGERLRGEVPDLPLAGPGATLVRSAVASWKPDVIYVSHYTQARLAHRLRETLGIPWVTCMHNGHSPKRMAQWAQLLTNTNGVVTMSRTMDQLYQDLVHSQKRQVYQVLQSNCPPHKHCSL